MCGGEDSTVPVLAVAGVVFGSPRRADSGDNHMSALGGAFLQSHAKAMTD